MKKNLVTTELSEQEVFDLVAPRFNNPTGRNALGQLSSVCQDGYLGDAKFLATLLSSLKVVAEKLNDFAELEKHIFAIYGSARTKEDTNDYELTAAVAAKFEELGWACITGGGPGMMEAAYSDLDDLKNALAFLLNLPHEPRSKYLQEDNWEMFEYFFFRKLGLMFAPSLVTGAKGGIGTVEELAEVFDLMANGHIPEMPVPLFGTHNSAWTEQVGALFNEVLPENLQSQLKVYTQDEGEPIQEAGQRIAQEMHALDELRDPPPRPSIASMVEEDIFDQLETVFTEQEVKKLIAQGDVERTLFANAAHLLTAMEEYTPFVAALAHDFAVSAGNTQKAGNDVCIAHFGGLQPQEDTTSVFNPSNQNVLSPFGDSLEATLHKDGIIIDFSDVTKNLHNLSLLFTSLSMVQNNQMPLRPIVCIDDGRIVPRVVKLLETLSELGTISPTDKSLLTVKKSMADAQDYIVNQCATTRGHNSRLLDPSQPKTSNTQITIDLGPFSNALGLDDLKAELSNRIVQSQQKDPLLSGQLATLRDSLVSSEYSSVDSHRRLDIVLKGRAKNSVISVLVDLLASPQVETTKLLSGVGQWNRPRHTTPPPFFTSACERQ